MKMCNLFRFITTATLIISAPRLAMAQIIEIPDPELRAVIRKTLNKPSGVLTVADLGRLTVLDVSRARRGTVAPVIRSLQGLQAARNLTLLNLSGANVFPGCVNNIALDDFSPCKA
jgi:hypothetical protein